jgi:hypothetical protein
MLHAGIFAADSILTFSGYPTANKIFKKKGDVVLQERF